MCMCSMFDDVEHGTNEAIEAQTAVNKVLEGGSFHCLLGECGRLASCRISRGNAEDLTAFDFHYIFLAAHSILSYNTGCHVLVAHPSGAFVRAYVCWSGV